MTDADARSLSPDPVVERPERRGSMWLVVALAVVIVGAAVFVSTTGRTQGGYVVVFLAVLAVIGVVALFAGAIGLIEVAGRSRRFDLARAIVDGLPDGAMVTDPAGRIVYANAAYAELTRAEGARDLRPLDQVFSGNPAMAEAIYRLNLAAREGRRHHEEVRVGPGEGPEGARRGAWLSLKVQPVALSKRGPTTVWTVGDVTRDRDRHETIFQALQHAIDYLDHAPAGFFSLGPDGRVGYVNATLAGWLGLDLGEAATGRVALTDIVPGAQVPLLRAIVAKPGEVATETFDLDLRDRSGRSRPVRLVHRVSFAADGTPGASRTLVLDRAPGSDSAEPLRAAEVRFARFFNNAPFAIATLDRDGAILRSNGAFAALKPDAAGRGMRLVDAVVEKDRAALEAGLAAVREGQAPTLGLEVTFTGALQRTGRVFLAGVDPGEGDGETTTVYVLDTTEQRALEQQVAQGVKMNAVGQLAGGIAHDFNNVLTAIIGNADLLLDKLRPSDPSFQEIVNIKSSANRAAGLVRQLLAFSRRQTLRPQVLGLSGTLSELTVMLSRLLGESVKLDMRHGRDLWPVKADLSQFEQVVINLAVNARDAMPEGGRLTITTENVAAEDPRAGGRPGMPPADYVLMTVADTGTGIPQEIIDKIFEPFFTTKEMGKGTGLGLSTVYGIVKQTGGFVYVDSEPGKGTTFSIFLPRHVPTAEDIAPAAAPAAERKPVDLTGEATILLVEDEDAVRAFAARALASRGYTVLEAGVPSVALDLMRENLDRIDLIVSDVQMPEMDGPTLVKELKAMKPGVRVVFMSGYAEEQFRRSVADGENAAFLAKPFALKQLAQVVKDALSR